MCPAKNHSGPVELRRKDRSSAVWFCVSCEGRVGTKRVPLRLLSTTERHSLKPMLRRKHRARPGKRRRDYRRFMTSRAWRVQRLRVFVRDGYVCQTPGCEEDAIEAAHLRYADPIQDTPDDWIVASCRDCNQRERENRIAFGRTA